MKAIICTAPGNLVLAEIAKPVRLPGQTLIRILRIGICGTDLHAFEGTQPYFTYPRILGHELSGEIAEADPDQAYKPGQLVTIIPYLHCGRCIACRTGKENCCVHMQVLGVHIDGGMVEYMSVPTAHLIVADDLDPDTLALVEPLAISAHGISRAEITPGEFVLIAGAGPIGMGVIDLARLAGGRAIAFDRDPARLDFCRRELGAAHVIEAGDGNIFEELYRITNGDMPAVIIDATGNLEAITRSFDYISHGGRYVLIGLQKETICFSHPQFHKKEATLMSSRNATRADFESVLELVRRNQLIPGKYITGRIPFSKVPERFSSNAGEGALNIKTIVCCD